MWQLALWEEYADEVEEQMRVLLADNALLQAALADVRSSLTHDRPPSAGASGARSIPPGLSLNDKLCCFQPAGLLVLLDLEVSPSFGCKAHLTTDKPSPSEPPFRSRA